MIFGQIIPAKMTFSSMKMNTKKGAKRFFFYFHCGTGDKGKKQYSGDQNVDPFHS